MFARERAVGIQAVLKASKLCQTVFKQLVKSQTIVKSDASPVTVADFGYSKKKETKNDVEHRQLLIN
jgi:3'(2'), 5'-bisphosphate nucleotidase